MPAGEAARLEEDAEPDADEPRTAAEVERVVAEAARAAVEAVREAAGTERVTVLAASEAVREAVDMRPEDALGAELPDAAALPPAVRTTRPTPARGLGEMLVLSPRVATSRP